MTIYAIVNDLLSSSDGSKPSSPVWTLISQAAILQGGNPFFVPVFAGNFQARMALAIRIGRLGKGIAPRFVSRYVEAAAPAILFVASDLLEHYRQAGLPWSQAISYDRALALGKFTNSTLEECKASHIGMSIESKDGTIEASWPSETLFPSIEDIVAAVSRYNALKMGDIILIGISDAGPQVTPDMRVHLSLNDSDSLSFNIR